MNRLLQLSFLAVLFPFSLLAQPQQQLAAIAPDWNHFSVNNDAPSASAELSGKLTRKQLLTAFKQLDVSDAAYNETDRDNLYKLAGLLTRMKLYPLAMKCFLKTLTPDSLTNETLPFSSRDQQILEAQLQPTQIIRQSTNSKFIRSDKILETFNDGKKALAYAMVFHVRQPVRGKAKVHKLIYTGHTYITLIKFNVDSSYATLSFGFGPKKDNPLSSTPLMPSSSSTLRDDTAYPWDEIVGKFISKRRFEKILQLAHQYDGLAYHLNKNNCTDFGLKAANLAGLEVKDTKGKWLLGGGNNPGTTGESILLGKFANADTGNLNRLYIDTARVSPLAILPVSEK